MFNKIRGLNQKPAETVPYAVILQITNYKLQRRKSKSDTAREYLRLLFPTMGYLRQDSERQIAKSSISSR